MTRESIVEAYLVAQVKAAGGEARKVTWQGRRGAPDRFVMLPQRGRVGRYSACFSLWVEVKATGETPPAYQLREHQRMRDMGQVVVVVDSIEGVEELLR